MATFLFLWLIALAIGVVLTWMFTVHLGRSAMLDIAPPVAVIVAAKDHDATFDEFLVRLFEQDYPNFRVIFTVETGADPAVATIEKCCAIAPHKVRLVVAGRAVDEGQKTANMRAAVAQLHYDDEILVFADADIWPEPDWLMRLVEPLLWRKADIVTGVPWVVANGKTLSGLILASLAAAMATMPRLPYMNAVWGASIAIRQDQFRALDVVGKWCGVLSDTLQLTGVAQRAGLRIIAPSEMLLRAPAGPLGFDEAIAKLRNWFMLMRTHMPAAYATILTGMSLAALGWILAIGGALGGRADAIAVLAVAMLLAVARLFVRRRLIRTLWGRGALKENRLLLWTDWAVAPLAAVIGAGCGWSALLMRRSSAAGIGYDVRGGENTGVLSRNF